MDKPTVQDIFHRFYPAYLDRKRSIGGTLVDLPIFLDN